MGARARLKADLRASTLRLLTKCEQRSNGSEFLFCAPWRFRFTAKILYHTADVLICLFEFLNRVRVRVPLDDNLSVDAMCPQKFLEHTAK